MKNIILLLLFAGHAYCNVTSKKNVRKFPKHFIFGTSTSAYQIEGAWNKDGKSESIWDRLVHTKPSPVIDNSTGDVACDSYRLYKRDVQMLRELGVDFYRFSLSWTRILPTSFPDKINQAGVDYYNNLINELLKYNIQPVVTLYHWDMPQKLQDLGGWPNPNIVDWYADYARIAFQLFGDRVKYWITINEPQLICDYGYGLQYMAPRFNYSGVADYMCARNLLLAHAKAYHTYNKEFRPYQKGSIFISIVVQGYDYEFLQFKQAAEDSFQFNTGIYAHPIFSRTGNWPSVIRARVAAKSKEQGFFRSRLPPFTPQEIKYIRGTSDYFGLNHYSTYYVYRNATSANEHAKPSFKDDIGATTYQLKHWKSKETDFVAMVPWGFYKVLMKVKQEYNNPIVFITENGFSTRDVGYNDDGRVAYFRGYLGAVLDAIAEGARVMAYTAWTLLDNFEWLQGYVDQFGLYQVDFNHEQRTRTPRKSAFVYKQIVRSRELDLHYEPATTVMTIDQGH